MTAPTSAVTPISEWKAKQIAEIERHPRQIEQRDRPDAAEETSDIVEIAQRLQAVVAATDQQRQPHDGVEDARC